MLETLVSYSTSAFIAVCWAAFGYAFALWLRVPGTTLRWTVGFTAAAWTSTALFTTLGYLHLLYTPVLACTAAIPAALAVLKTGPRALVDAIERDLHRGIALARSLDWWARIPLGLTAIAYSILALAGITSPVLGWDSLSYHLVHIVHWAQDHGFAMHPAPDAWGYYQYFSTAGEIFFAWLAIPTRSGVTLPLSGVIAVGVAAVAAHASARAIGARNAHALLASAALIAVPAVSTSSTNGYVDNYILALTACALAAALHATGDADPRERGIMLVTAGAAAGLAAAVKLPAALVLLVCLAVAFLSVFRARSGWRMLTAMLCAALAVLLPRLLEVWHFTGEPLYPFRLAIGRHVIAQGNEELTALMALERLELPGRVGLGSIIQQLFWTEEPNLARQPVHLNFGLGAVLTFAMGIGGLAWWLRTRRRDSRWVLLVAMGATCVPYLVSPSNLALRTLFVWVLARFLLAALLVAAVTAAVLPGKATRIALGAAILAGWAQHQMIGMCTYRWVGTGGAALAIAAACFMLWLASRTHNRWAVWAVVVAGILGTNAAVSTLREELDYLIARGTGRGECQDGQRFTYYGSNAEAWEALADAPSQTIAFTGGFDGTGHNLFRYPLFGKNWQHRVIYMPPTGDGRILNHSQLYAPGAEQSILSYESWVQRLERAEVSYVAISGPWNTAESRWVEQHGDRFVREELDPRTALRLYRFISK